MALAINISPIYYLPIITDFDGSYLIDEEIAESLVPA